MEFRMIKVVQSCPWVLDFRMVLQQWTLRLLFNAFNVHIHMELLVFRGFLETGLDPHH